MIDLGLNQYKIKEIKYELKEGKTVIFKLNYCNLEDVEIVEEEKKCCDKCCTCDTTKTVYDGIEESKIYADAKNVAKDIVTERQENKAKGTEEDKFETFSLECLDKYGPKKHIDDYEPISCLRNEKGMQETLESSRRKRWKDDVMKNPSKGTPTGNALIKIDDTINEPLKPNESKKPKNATIGEIRAFNVKQKLSDSKVDTEYRDKIEKKLAKDLINSKMLIDEYLVKMPQAEKEAFTDRVKTKYFTDGDKYDEFSKLLSLNLCSISPDLNKEEQKTLDASKKGEWREDIKNHDINPANYKMVSLDEKYKDATKEEKMKASGEIIKKMAEKDSEIDKKRNDDRANGIYFSDDPNDVYSKIKSFGDIDTEKTKFIEFLKDKPYETEMPEEYLEEEGKKLKKVGTIKVDRETDEIIEFKPKTLKERDEAGLKSIINIFKEGNKEENKE